MLAVIVVCFLIVQRLVGSRIGRALVALRENEALARSIGINVTRYLVIATVISAGMAGAAGGLYAFYIRIVDPDVFLFIYTVTMVIMVIAGGKGTLDGPIVGGLLFGILPGAAARRGAARGAVDSLRRGDGPDRVLPARGIVPAAGRLLPRSWRGDGDAAAVGDAVRERTLR